MGIGATLAAMVGVYGREIFGVEGDPFRVGAQVMSGIGFLGAGTILVRSTAKVRGLTTAAGLWCMAAVGLACGIGFYSGAVIATALSLAVVALPAKIETRWSKQHRLHTLYLEVDGLHAVNPLVRMLDLPPYHLLGLEIHSARSALPGLVGLQLVLRITNDLSEEENVDELLKLPGVNVVLPLK